MQCIQSFNVSGRDGDAFRDGARARDVKCVISGVNRVISIGERESVVMEDELPA